MYWRSVFVIVFLLIKYLKRQKNLKCLHRCTGAFSLSLSFADKIYQNPKKDNDKDKAPLSFVGEISQNNRCTGSLFVPFPHLLVKFLRSQNLKCLDRCTDVLFVPFPLVCHPLSSYLLRDFQTTLPIGFVIEEEMYLVIRVTNL